MPWCTEVYTPDGEDLISELGEWETATAGRAACFNYANTTLNWQQLEDGEWWAKGPEWWFRVYAGEDVG
ncbi:hypothetical protein [Deinococcus sonorensis]|uniref:Uncharacterized protein n=1 Tax=Deinococcus sonorensis TaxID=309891 RepID=A0ABV8YCM0_9DEIO